MPNWSWSRSNKASPTSKTPSSPGDASKTKYGEPNESPNSNKGTNDNDHQEPQGPRDPAPQSDRIRPRMHDRPDYAVNAYKEGKAAAKNELERKRANGDFAAAIFRAKTEATKAAYRLKEAEAEQEMIHKSFDRQLEESNKKIATTTAFLSGKKKEKSLPDEALATIQARSVEDAEMALRKAREEKEAIESNRQKALAQASKSLMMAKAKDETCRQAVTNAEKAEAEEQKRVDSIWVGDFDLSRYCVCCGIRTLKVEKESLTPADINLLRKKPPAKTTKIEHGVHCGARHEIRTRICGFWQCGFCVVYCGVLIAQQEDEPCQKPKQKAGRAAHSCSAFRSPALPGDYDMARKCACCKEEYIASDQSFPYSRQVKTAAPIGEHGYHCPNHAVPPLIGDLITRGDVFKIGRRCKLWVCGNCVRLCGMLPKRGSDGLLAPVGKDGTQVPAGCQAVHDFVFSRVEALMSRTELQEAHARMAERMMPVRQDNNQYPTPEFMLGDIHEPFTGSSATTTPSLICSCCGASVGTGFPGLRGIKYALCAYRGKYSSRLHDSDATCLHVRCGACVEMCEKYSPLCMSLDARSRGVDIAATGEVVKRSNNCRVRAVLGWRLEGPQLPEVQG